jgi:hypothetical protein
MNVSDIKDGGPAFPTDEQIHANGQIEYAERGMTLRDYFAAQALSGLVLRAWSDDKVNVPADVHDRWSKAAYLTADAMLKAREA